MKGILLLLVLALLNFSLPVEALNLRGLTWGVRSEGRQIYHDRL